MAWKDSTKIFHVEFYGVNVEAESRSEKGGKNFVERQLFGLLSSALNKSLDTQRLRSQFEGKFWHLR